MIIGAIGSIEYEPGGKEGGDGGVDNLACPSGGWRRLRGGLMGGGGGVAVPADPRRIQNYGQCYLGRYSTTGSTHEFIQPL